MFIAVEWREPTNPLRVECKPEEAYRCGAFSRAIPQKTFHPYEVRNNHTLPDIDTSPLRVRANFAGESTN